MTPILDERDIAVLVDSFYEKVFQNESLSPFFKQLNYPEHRLKMIHFWSFVLLDIPGYTTQVFDMHAKMNIPSSLFKTWVDLFCENIDSQFTGELAENAKLRARTMGWTFAEKLKKKENE